MSIRFLPRFFPFLNRPARTKRFEILLPLNYNDGRLIEPEKFDQTAEEFCDRFGGVTGATFLDRGGRRLGGRARSYCRSAPRVRAVGSEASLSANSRSEDKTALSWIRALLAEMAI